MQVGWQDISALAIVLAAVLYLLHFFRNRATAKQTGGCVACKGCGATASRQLVTLTLPGGKAGKDSCRLSPNS